MQLIKVLLSELFDHPDNPRVVMREDVVESIAVQLKAAGEFSQKHAVHVRPIEGGYQVISGHHRKAGTARAGLDSVWAWSEDMDDDTAFMALVLSNAQGELDPLEIGIHAFQAVPEGKRGRGNKGDGLKAYAKTISKHAGLVTEYRQAGEVFKNIHLSESFLGKAKHLAAIHKLPKECWQLMAEWVAAKSPSVAEVKPMVDRIDGICKCVAGEPFPATMFPFNKITERCLSTTDFSGSTVVACVSIVGACIAKLEDSGIADAEIKSMTDELVLWCESNIGGDSWNKRKLEAFCDALIERIKEASDEVADGWRLGDWRDHIGSVDDGAIKLLLIDPPYGMDYQSNRRADKHEKIESDGTVDDARDELLSLSQAVFCKMADDSHVLCFCRWDSESSFVAMLRTAGFTVKGGLVWVKQNHGSGDLKGGFAPKHERIIHAVKGSPVLYERHPDVLEYAKETSENHPTEKPTELLEKLIECTTVEGQLVADFFAGVGSTCVAANNSSRRWFGVEIEQKYYDIGTRRLGGVRDE